VPRYDYKCNNKDCSKEEVQFRSVDDRDRTYPCPEIGCTGTMIKQLTLGSVIHSRNVPSK